MKHLLKTIIAWAFCETPGNRRKHSLAKWLVFHGQIY